MVEEIDLLDRLDAVADSLVEAEMFLHASTVDEVIDEIQYLRDCVKNLEEKVEKLEDRCLM